MPLANFPVKPRTPNRVTEFKLPAQQAKRGHRGARIYEVRSPGLPRPEAAFIHDRPAPILALPGLPPSPVTFAFPVDEPKEKDKSPKGFAKKMLKSGKACASLLACKRTMIYISISWFDQVKLPFAKESDPLTPRIPPTPKTADWANESWSKEPTPNYANAASFQKKTDMIHSRNGSDELDEWRRDPPPLYTKHPEEGGLKAWLAVVGA